MESIFNAMFILVPLFIGIIFVVVIGSIIVAIVRGIAEWRNNNAQPLLKVTASVVTKRQHVSGGGNDTSSSEETKIRKRFRHLKYSPWRI